MNTVEFPEESRVWVYQSERIMGEEEMSKLQPLLDEFCMQWTAHNHQLKAKAEIRYHRFIVLMVDETQANTTGCSIDKSIHFMHQLEDEFGLSLFNRMLFTYKKDDEITISNRSEFESKLRSSEITDQTIVFNNLVQSKKELDTNWEIALKDSWHKQFFS